jgi:transcription elongation factor Elf1
MVLLLYLVFLFAAFLLLLVGLPLFAIARSVEANKKKRAAELWELERPARLAKLEVQAAAALPYIQAFEASLLQKFHCRPCPRCGEPEMFVLSVSPHGRSCEVSCKHCTHKFRWKAVHPDTADVATAYRSFMEALAGTSYRHVVSVPPDKGSAPVAAAN